MIVTNYFSALAKGSCNKKVISLGCLGSADSAVPRLHGLQFYRLVLPHVLPVTTLRDRPLKRDWGGGGGGGLARKNFWPIA